MNPLTDQYRQNVELALTVFSAEILNLNCLLASYIAANQVRLFNHENIAYTEESFHELAEKAITISESALKVQKSLSDEHEPQE